MRCRLSAGYVTIPGLSAGFCFLNPLCPGLSLTEASPFPLQSDDKNLKLMILSGNITYAVNAAAVKKDALDTGIFRVIIRSKHTFFQTSPKQSVLFWPFGKSMLLFLIYEYNNSRGFSETGSC